MSDIRAIEKALGFMASAIKSGEPWSQTAEQMYHDAANEIDRFRTELAERDEQEPADAWLITSDGEQACAVDDEAAADILARAGCKVERLYRHPPAPAAVPLEAIQYAYNSGYNAGHHDTVEGNATPLTHRELTRERDESASEIMSDLKDQGLIQSAEPASRSESEIKAEVRHPDIIGVAKDMQFKIDGNKRKPDPVMNPDGGERSHEHLPVQYFIDRAYGELEELQEANNAGDLRHIQLEAADVANFMAFAHGRAARLRGEGSE